jgi:hypothetical protein
MSVAPIDKTFQIKPCIFFLRVKAVYLVILNIVPRKPKQITPCRLTANDQICNRDLLLDQLRSIKMNNIRY